MEITCLDCIRNIEHAVKHGRVFLKDADWCCSDECLADIEATSEAERRSSASQVEHEERA